MVDKIVGAVADNNNDADGLEIKLPTGSVSFDKDAVAAISEKTGSKDLTLHLDDIKVTELNTAQQGAVQTMNVQVVLDAYLTAGTERVTDFGNGKATVKVPYTLKDNQSSLGIVVWYVDSKGVTTQINAKYDGQNVVFEVPHFSNYIIAYDAERAKECPKDSTCPMSEFKDLIAAAWYHDGVHWALGSGVMRGYEDGLFRPDAAASRAMIATMLWNLEGKPAAKDGALSFTDVPKNAWYVDAVSWASSEKLVTGYDDGSFKADASVTREQLATILYRYAKYKNMDVSKSASLSSFTDAKTVRSYATDAMKWAVGSGIINGDYQNGVVKLLPSEASSRVVVATMFYRFCR